VRKRGWWWGEYNFGDGSRRVEMNALFMRFFQEEFLQVSILQRLILHLTHKQHMHAKTRVLPDNQSPRILNISIPRLAPTYTAQAGGSRGTSGGTKLLGQGNVYQWHWFPDFFACGTDNSLIAPTMFCLVGFGNGGEFGDVLSPPVFMDVFVVTGHEALGETDVFMVARRDTSVESLHGINVNPSKNNA